ncbi:nitrate- and nitrite sensing domain-containing protein [Kitasatospora sp. NBC_01287]|uniref:sensor histidine kinase n=1 Tax=Kitasatospora sp. NBC_01287 TaxID=2903573 RepID=UPI00224F6703|nr:nitrate- and nitrite sensing domain-containing protein [Kitasatospora sp. NBC_01287]MCX4746613.1 nitrate- and nitrite sensing domain-containing protein [Kitasatospora sp. NBC_01287]
MPGDRLTNGDSEVEPDLDDEDGEGRGNGRARLRVSLTRRRNATGFGRLRMRNWRIRTRLIALLLLPVVVALVLGGLRISSSAQSSQQLAQMTNLSDLAVKATALADALQTERDVSAGPLTEDKSKQYAQVDQAQKATDAANKAYNARADSFDGTDLSGGNSLLMQVRTDMELLSTTRTNAYGDKDNIEATVTSYDTIIKDLLSISQDIALGSSNPDLVKATRALEQFSEEKESSSEQRALISAALARPGGADLSNSDQSFGLRLRTAYSNAITNFNSIYGTTAALKLRARQSYNTNISLADRYASQVLTLNGIKQADPRTYEDWYEQSSVRIDADRAIEGLLLDNLKNEAQTLQSQADNDVILNGVVVALVLLVAVIGAALVARSMVRSLTKLQTAAEDVAERRLPELVKTLSESDPHDVDVTVEPVGIDSSDEIGHVAHAFDMVHSEAVRLAAEQALLRGNINSMFTNLSRRSQGLIQRQLSLISELESREADPDQLASLFKLDHLATRMRRNGENLLVLAGEDPGRRWTRPVPLVDVLRAAASEVEQYERIELATVPSAEVAGRVVNDLVHLLAELLENATSFSSPQTRVRVTGHSLPDGRVLVEIHDTGIGLSPDDLAEINERLANPPTVDVSVSRRMGLFVVGRLSLRHGIRIQLRPSDSGGTTALVMLPVDVTNSADRRAPRPGQGQGGLPGKGQRGVAPTPRQQRTLPGAPAPALGQGGGPPAAPWGSPRPEGGGSRPQLGQGPQGPGQGGAPAAPTAPAGGLPTRAVGQSLRETPPPGRPQQGARRPGAPAGGPGLPRRGAPAPAPQQGQQAPQGQQMPQDPTGEQPQHGRADGRGQGPGVRGDVGPNGRPGGLPQRRPGQQGPGQQGPGQQGPGQQQAPGRPGQGRQAPGQQGQGPQGPVQQGQGQGRPQGQQGPGQPLPGRPGRPAVRPGQQQPGQQPAQRPQAPVGDPQGPPTVQQPVIAQGAPAPTPVESTVPFARPAFEASQIDPRDPLGLGLVEPVLPSVANPAPRPVAQQQPQFQQQAPQQVAPQQPQQPMALPPRRATERGTAPAGPREEEQPGVRTGGANRMASVQVNQQQAERQQAQQQERSQPYQPQRPGTTAPGFTEPQPPQGPGQGQQAPGQQAPGQGRAPFGGPGQGPGDAPWRPSANDERWRRAEQVREPSSDGVTLSGLPRRTPQANLVSGTAEAAPLTGPQVSRAPEEVRGRLTNLRRGIQQGRRAGAEATQGIPVQGMPDQGQQFDGFGRPAGTDPAQGDYRSAAPDPFGDGGRGGYGYGTENQER